MLAVAGLVAVGSVKLSIELRHRAITTRMHEREILSRLSQSCAAARIQHCWRAWHSANAPPWECTPLQADVVSWEPQPLTGDDDTDEDAFTSGLLGNIPHHLDDWPHERFELSISPVPENGELASVSSWSEDGPLEMSHSSSAREHANDSDRETSTIEHDEGVASPCDSGADDIHPLDCQRRWLDEQEYVFDDACKTDSADESSEGSDCDEASFSVDDEGRPLTISQRIISFSRIASSSVSRNGSKVRQSPGSARCISTNFDPSFGDQDYCGDDLLPMPCGLFACIRLRTPQRLPMRQPQFCS